MQKSNMMIYQLLHNFFSINEPIQQVKAGTILFQEKELVNYIYLIVKGSIAIGRVHESGKDFTLKILSHHEILVEYQLFSKNPYYQFNAKTHTDCELIMIKKEQFEEFVSLDPDAMNALFAWLSISYIKAQIKCMDLIMNGKRGGLYSILIRLSNSYGVATPDGILIDIPITHQELANLTFGTREVIQRLLKDLREKEIISYDQQKFIIKKLSYLKQEVDCQNCKNEICGIN
ncbi:Crp/Fnr family transcriptional regulator [Bacillus salipaludis]|uniref:Crp/Fnr family transcriptional regulator n=1 Tax=Bacillus salipaludis TaxID=2547811 RepID=A0AA90TTL8_9BACI|nr:Crp/Fnr family transcriptional regulator [Bacillus salipaludis]MDQ6599670.1 Crp/Fnr family transcriptional regulator [Bacillus salipaludis]